MRRNGKAVIFGMLMASVAGPALADQVLSGWSCPTLSLDYLDQDPAGVRTTATDVAKAIATQFPNASRYQPLHEVRRSYSSTTVTANGTFQSGLIGITWAGVTAKPRGPVIDVQYRRGNQLVDRSLEQSPLSSTSVRLMVDEASDQPGHFTLTCGPLKEDLARNFLFLQEKPLDQIDLIGEDIVATLAKLKPRILRLASVAVDLDVSFPTNAVFASLERNFGRPISVRQAGIAVGSYDGDFNVSLSGMPATRVRMTVTPYQTGTRVHAAMTQNYELLPDRGIDYVPNVADVLKHSLEHAVAN